MEETTTPELSQAVKEFLASIDTVPWFSGIGELPEGCLLFDTRKDARDATVRDALEAALNAAWRAAEEAALNASRDVAWDAEGKAAWDAARYAARQAAGGPAWKVAGDAAWKVAAAKAARDAAWGASLVAACISAWNNPTESNTIYAAKRWSVWAAGFGLLCDVGGTLYCYRRVA